MKLNENETSSTEMVTIPRAEYEAAQAEIAELTQKLNWLMEQLRLTKKKVYGFSSEHAGEETMEQISLLFHEAETYAADGFQTEEKISRAAAHSRKRRSSGLRDAIPEGVPVEVVEHRIAEEERICPECGTVMTEIGKEIRQSLVIVPAQVKIREDWYYTYACQKCKVEEIEVPVKKAERTPSVIPGSHASPEAIAHIMTQKFVMASPLYRQEQEWGRQGIGLSRQTMSYWLLTAADRWLKPIYDVLHRELVRRDVLHADETTLQVLREPGKSARTKSYMWLYRTSGDTKRSIVLYEYQANRKAANAENFLNGFHGWLHADGYSGYHNLSENIRVAGCWAHVRRKFDEALNAVPKEKRAGAPAAVGQAYCARLFSIEGALNGLPAEERRKQRLEREKPVLDELLAWAETKSAPPKSALGKALHYLREQWPYLIRYLEDGRLEISNNRAERSIKPFVIGRKNFLFANTPGGARSSAVIYSLVETAKENGLDPCRYLVHILSTAPSLSGSDETWAEKLVPWNAPDECRTLLPN